MMDQSRSYIFLYPGQGTQRPGMLNKLSELGIELQRWKSLFRAECDYELEKLCNPALTSVCENDVEAQLATYCYSVILADYLADRGVQPAMVCGYSSGLYAALVACGAVAWQTGFALTRDIGQLIMEHGAGKGGIGVILGLPKESVVKICDRAADRGFIMITHINSETLFLVGGEYPALDFALTEAQKNGATMAQPLKMNAPYHTPLLADASRQLAAKLHSFEIHDPQIPLLDYRTNRTLLSRDAVIDMVTDHFIRTVRWSDCMERVLQMENSCIVEIGFGKSLTRILQRMAGNVAIVTVESLLAKGEAL